MNKVQTVFRVSFKDGALVGMCNDCFTVSGGKRNTRWTSAKALCRNIPDDATPCFEGPNWKHQIICEVLATKFDNGYIFWCGKETYIIPPSAQKYSGMDPDGLQNSLVQSLEKYTTATQRKLGKI